MHKFCVHKLVTAAGCLHFTDVRTIVLLLFAVQYLITSAFLFLS